MDQGRTYNIFISYASKDARWRDLFETHLEPIRRLGLVDFWTDEKIKASANWLEEIEKALDTADVGLLLVTANFLASQFIMEKELPFFVRAQAAGRCRIVWVLIRDSQWQRVESLKTLQAVNSNLKRPLQKMDVAARATEITRIIDEMLEVASQVSSPVGEPVVGDVSSIKSSGASPARSLAAYRDRQAGEVMRVLRTTSDATRPGVAVLEPFGFGAKEVVDRVLEKNDGSFVPVFLQPDWRTDDNDRLYRKLCRDLRWGIESRIDDETAHEWQQALVEDESLSWMQRFDQSVEDLVGVARRHEQRLLLVVAQLERVRREVLEVWSGMLSELGRQGLSLLARGGRDLHELRRDATTGASAFHELEEVRLGPLERGEIERLFGENLDIVAAETGGHPQLVAELLECESDVLESAESVRAVLARCDHVARGNSLIKSDPALQQHHGPIPSGNPEIDDRLVWLGVLREASKTRYERIAPVFRKLFQSRST